MTKITYWIIGAVAFLLLFVVFAYSRGGSAAGAALVPQQSFSHSHGMAVDTADARKLYIATHEGLYLLQGEKDLFRVGEMRDDLMGFTAHPTSGGMFFSSGHPARGGNIGFQKTVDGGFVWEKVSNGIHGPVDFHAMAVSQVNPDIVYGSFRGLQRSIDGGRTWEMTKGAVQPFSLSTDSVRESVVYAATGSGIMVSEDRGDSWHSLSPELNGGAVSVFAVAPDSSYALAFSAKLGGLGKSADGGVTWRKVDEPFDGQAVLSIAYARTEPIVYALTGANTLYKSADAGETWSNIR